MDEAKAESERRLAALVEARTILGDAEKIVRIASNALFKYAANEQFTDINNTVRRDIIAVDAENLAGHAANWELALKPRLKSLRADLDNMNRYRDNLVITLRGLVTNAIAKLRAAQRVSKLPDTLDEWSGQEFLRIRFGDLDLNAVDQRLGDVIDELANSNEIAKKRDGMSVVLKGVKAAIPKGFHVEILKPDSTVRTERVRISDVGDVFSGGQELTAAIILYCTMAALRANDKGKTRHTHSGVLFLDNPLGRASANYLLDLQIRVADKLGVQLVYTTGIYDLNALSAFPLIVRLRNDADVRSGMKYLTVDDEIKKNLNSLALPNGTGEVTPTRLFRKPDSPAPV